MYSNKIISTFLTLLLYSVLLLYINSRSLFFLQISTREYGIIWKSRRRKKLVLYPSLLFSIFPNEITNEIYRRELDRLSNRNNSWMFAACPIDLNGGYEGLFPLKLQLDGNLNAAAGNAFIIENSVEEAKWYNSLLTVGNNKELEIP